MKKLLTLALAAIMCAGSAKALDYVPEPGFTFQGFFGMNISNFRYTDSSADCLTDPKAGFNIGVRGEYMLPSCYGVFVNLGVGYTMKGAKLDDVVGLEGRDVTVKYRPYYIEIPLHVGYRYNVLENLGVYADFGPYFAIGVNGKEKYDFDSDAVKDYSHKFFRNNCIGETCTCESCCLRKGTELNRTFLCTLDRIDASWKCRICDKCFVCGIIQDHRIIFQCIGNPCL